MKRGTPDHPKARALAARLKLRRWEVVGLLESLWHFASGYARRGDVGRHTDDEIASHLEWGGDARELVEALVATRWLDRCACHRLRIHDWPDHADQTVRRSQEVKTSGFIGCYTDPDARIKLAPARDLLAAASNLPADASQPVPLPLPSPGPMPGPEPSPSPARPPRARDAAEAWARVLALTRGPVTEHSWATWLQPTTGVALEGDELRVEVPSREFLTWIAHNYREPIAVAMDAEGLGDVRLVFVVPGERAHAPPRARAG